jgi:hypothetical protein
VTSVGSTILTFTMANFLIDLFINLLIQAPTLEENQNSKDYLHPDTAPGTEANNHGVESSQPSGILPQPQEETTNLSPQPLDIEPKPEIMEVHKHPHHVMHKKKWNEYLLEFFMLFLAVFLGFLAENQRERIVEHEREKTYAGRLLLDLEQDSALFHVRKQEFEQRRKDDAHLFTTLSENANSSDSAVISSFLPLLKTWSPDFTTATYNQMKSSGGLRYIRNEELTTQMQKYYDVILPGIQREITDLRKVFTDLILPHMVKHFRFQDWQDAAPKKYILLNRTKDSDQELLNIMGAYDSGWGVVFDYQESAFKKTQELIRLLKTTYHL